MWSNLLYILCIDKLRHLENKNIYFHAWLICCGLVRLTLGERHCCELLHASGLFCDELHCQDIPVLWNWISVYCRATRPRCKTKTKCWRSDNIILQLDGGWRRKESLSDNYELWLYCPIIPNYKVKTHFHFSSEAHLNIKRGLKLDKMCKMCVCAVFF